MTSSTFHRFGSGVRCPIAERVSKRAILDDNNAVARASSVRLPMPNLRTISSKPAGIDVAGRKGRRPGRHSVVGAVEGSFADRPLAEEARRLQETDREAKHEIQSTDPVQLYGRPTAWPDYGIGPKQQRRELLARLRREGYIQTDRVEQAMRDIDRGAFMPETATIGRYSNLVVELGYNTFMHVRLPYHDYCFRSRWLVGSV